MARRADHTREELKNLILDTAWRIVGREGFDGLTARGIAAEIGYAPGTIYNVFQSMDDLHLQINSRTLDMLYSVLNGAEFSNPSKDTVRNMKAMASQYASFARQHRAYWLMLFSRQFSAGWQAPSWYEEKIERLFEPLENLLKPLFSPRQASKRKMAARTLWASVHGICFLEQTGKVPSVDKREPVGEMTAMLIDAFVKGLSSER